jgi:hypothetical protein
MEEQKKQKQENHSLTYEFVPYTLALRMKALDYNESCMAYYNKSKKLHFDKYTTSHWSSTCLAPLYQQAFRWFRDNHKLQHNINWNKFYTDTPYGWEVRKQWTDEPLIPYGHSGMSKTYEEAELACLKKLIEIVEFKLE